MTVLKIHNNVLCIYTHSVLGYICNIFCTRKTAHRVPTNLLAIGELLTVAYKIQFYSYCACKKGDTNTLNLVSEDLHDIACKKNYANEIELESMT